MNQDIQLRGTFDSDALTYHAVRPRYPDGLFNTLVQATVLRADARLLEIGPGTGQATASLAVRNYEIVAVELGESLAAVARNALNGFPKVTVITGAFEGAVLPESRFDLVYSATAFHWIDPSVRYKKPHRILKPGGHLAVIRSEHVSDEAGDEFFFASQAVYQKYWPGDEEFRIPRTRDLRPLEVDTKLFIPKLFKAYPVAIRYSAEEYCKLLSTYSPTLALPQDARISFLQGISDLITQSFSGFVTKQYAMTLAIAQKAASFS